MMTIRKKKTIAKLLALVVVIGICSGAYVFRDRINAMYQMASLGAVQTSVGIYKGDLSFGIREGIGTIELANGDQYSGAWLDNLPNGLGSFEYCDGDLYEGNYVNGRKG